MKAFYGLCITMFSLGFLLKEIFLPPVYLCMNRDPYVPIEGAIF